MDKTRYMSEFKYKVGDKVLIKSLDWYNENKASDDEIRCYPCWFGKEQSKWCGKVMTITHVKDDHYIMSDDDGYFDWTDEMIEGLVERNGKTYPYKIGDRVILKGNNRCATITDLKYNSWGNLSYYIKIDNDIDISIDYPTDLLLPYDNTIEGLVEEETKPKYEDEVNGEYYSTPKYLVRPSGYQFVDENGNVINAMKIVLEKKKKAYPKTFEECVSVLMREGGNRMHLELMNTFRKLIDARNAYWTIYGVENGLGKPWEPDYTDSDQDRYAIVNFRGNIEKSRWDYGYSISFVFPTEEMRDAFYENFKEEIEMCKEFL